MGRLERKSAIFRRETNRGGIMAYVIDFNDEEKHWLTNYKPPEPKTLKANKKKTTKTSKKAAKRSAATKNKTKRSKKTR